MDEPEPGDARTPPPVFQRETSERMEELEPEQQALMVRDRNEAILIFAASLALIAVTIAVARQEEILQAAYFAGSVGAGFSFWATWRLRRCLDVDPDLPLLAPMVLASSVLTFAYFVLAVLALIGRLIEFFTGRAA